MGLFDAIFPPTGQISQAGRVTGKAIPQATAQQVAGLQGQQGTLSAAEQASLAAQNQAAGQETGYFNQALGLYQPLAQGANAAFGMYGNALGLGGAAGNQAAVNAFQTDPGYQFQMQQGLDALQRNANSRGMLASGNLTQDELQYSQGLANQDYQQWLSNLWNQGSLAPGIAGAQAGQYSNLANVAANQGANTANIYGQFAPQIGQTQSDIGQAQAGGTLGAAQNKAQTLANLFNANQQGSQNFLGLLGSAFGPAAYLGGKAYG